MGGSAGSGGGGGRKDACPRLMFVFLADTLPNLKPGAQLHIEARKNAVVALTAAGDTAGTIAPTPGLVRLLECLNQGVEYEGLIESIDGGAVRVQVTRK